MFPNCIQVERIKQHISHQRTRKQCTCIDVSCDLTLSLVKSAPRCRSLRTSRELPLLAAWMSRSDAFMLQLATRRPAAMSNFRNGAKTTLQHRMHWKICNVSRSLCQADLSYLATAVLLSNRKVASGGRGKQPCSSARSNMESDDVICSKILSSKTHFEVFSLPVVEVEDSIIRKRYRR